MHTMLHTQYSTRYFWNPAYGSQAPFTRRGNDADLALSRVYIRRIISPMMDESRRSTLRIISRNRTFP